MAKFNPPANFSFDKPAEWPNWKQRFVRFKTPTKLSNEDGVVQVSSLIYAMGSEAENVFRSFTFGENEDENDFDVVLAKFDEYFVPCRNVITSWHASINAFKDPGKKQRIILGLCMNCWNIVKRTFTTEL